LLPALFVGVRFDGALGAAWAMLATGGVAVSMDLPLILRLLKMPISRVLAASWRPVASAVVLGVVVKTIEWQWGPLQSSLASAKLLAVAVASGALCYVFAAFILWSICGKPDGAERNTLNAFIWAWQKKKRRA
jgi:chromate transport protein ChrA